MAIRLSKEVHSHNKIYINKYSFDLKFLGLVILLLLIGMLLIYDASIAYSLNTFGNKYYFLLKHLSWVALGLVGFTFFSLLNLNLLRKYSLFIFVISILCLILVLIPSPFAPSVYGARRWLIINPSPFPAIPLLGTLSFQPSELAKLSGIIYFATLLTGVKARNSQRVRNINYLGLTGFICGLILLQPNFSTSMIVAFALTVMYFVSGASMKIVLTEIPLFSVVAVLYALSSAYRRSRIITLITGGDNLEAGYHIKQVLIALGSGGFFGLGLGSSVQKYAYLPEVTADSIFAILGEELGFVGASFLVILYMCLIWRGFKIASSTKDPFLSLIAYGIVSWVGIQTVINLFAMIKLFPITGIPLPLVSYGGSSTVILLFALGILFNISRSGQNIKSEN